mgnify:FL=1
MICRFALSLLSYNSVGIDIYQLPVLLSEAPIRNPGLPGYDYHGQQLTCDLRGIHV